VKLNFINQNIDEIKLDENKNEINLTYYAIYKK